jgi:AcrR family transcriptional regulator
MRDRITTRDRILDAAVLRFSKASYEETGLRDIGEDVGVDVAYVHRCFGSKERLFAEAIAAAVRPADLLADAKNNLSDTLAGQIFGRDAARSRSDVGPLDIVIRSLTSPDASRVLRDFVQNDFIEPLAKTLKQPSSTRAALIASFLTGLGIFRSVLGIEPLLEAKGGELEYLITHVIEAMISADRTAERS